MDNPFKISAEKLQDLMIGYEAWIKSDPKEEKYPQIEREKSNKIKEDFLNPGVLQNMSDDELYDKIFKYSRKLEGPVQIRLGEPRLRGDLPEIRRNLEYIMTSEETPFMVAQNILEGKYKIEVFAKAFWSPILQAQFPNVLPNWNNKTEKFLKKFGINISTSKLTIAEKYKILSDSFTALSELSEGHDFYSINHLMHYGTVIQQGISQIEEITGNRASDPVISLIKKYKDRIRVSKLDDERYKWELCKKFYGRPDLNAPDFPSEIKNIDFSNLLYPMALAVKNLIANAFPNEYRNCFVKLFDEDEDLTIRVKNFMAEVLIVYQKADGKLSHHHDERTISTFLTFHNPEKYTFFKDTFYQEYCKIVGIEPKSKGEKYAHYLELVADFVENYILPDTELINLVKGYMTPECYNDKNHLLMVQDILYQMLDKKIEEPGEIDILNLSGQRLYKISHGVFKKKPTFKKADISGILEQNNWISMGTDTGKGQAKEFTEKAAIGDFVYVCYGGDELYCIGKIASNAKEFSDEIIKKLDDDEEWIYREIEPLYFPVNNSIKELKSDAHFFMPSGNSTFYEVPKDQLEYINKTIFIPKFNLNIIDNQTGIKEGETSVNIKSVINESLNIILFGPPGTGKTYGTIDKSLKILGETISGMKRKDMKKMFSGYQKSNRVFFTTFHQNMAYEDFIEGIKPVEPLEDDEFLRYEIQDGLFMRACVEATFNFIRSNFGQDKTVEELLDFNGLFDKLIDRISKTGSEKISTKTGSWITATITSQGNISIKHEGRDKPYTVSRERLSKLYEKFPYPEEISNINDSFRKTIGGSNSTAYWSVLNEIVKLGKTAGKKEVIVPASADIAYEDKRKVVKNYWEKKDYSVVAIDQSNPYVFIIDEINRGNVAQIFGELITLIEDDKRMGKQETLFAELPYSKHSFAIPPNLYIVGTMNTADRSVEALDSALRRRFSFIEMVPLPEKLHPTTDGIDLPKILHSLNNRLLILKDHDHTIGHAWLMGVINVEQLKCVFGNKILPLLKEYFYNDYEKLGLVLGDAFFKPHEQVSSDVFASFSGGNGLAGQYDQSWNYRLKSAEELTIADFQSLIGK